MRPRIALLAGGVGGARFLRGLSRRTDPARLTVIGNTGDDEEFFGLHVSPDLDTLLYTLAGRTAPRRGWGVRNESWHCLEELGRLGEPQWFRLGDRDLATHLFRTDRLRRGWPLSRVTGVLAAAHGIRATIIPMTDDRVRTFVHTGAGRLAFQDYLVRRAGRGRVERIEVAGGPRARPAPRVLASLDASDAIIIGPSNPLVSIEPILAVRGVRSLLRRRRDRVVAVTPLVGGRPLRGPLHRMLRGLGLEVSPRGVARRYADVAGTFVLDTRDAPWRPEIEALGMRVVVTDTVMRTPAIAGRLAAVILDAIGGRRR
jgi:LPPG:FO 2-phospho-L-lactate transferase